MTLSPAQIEAYAAAAGFSGADLATSVAIALAESSGDPGAYNPEGSYGLWQIYLPAHPQYAGANLNDPATNAAAAFAIYSAAGGFSPWTTYTSGSYQKYLAMVPGANTSMTASAGTVMPAFTPSTSVMPLPSANFSQNLTPSTDFSSIALAIGLGLAVLLAFEVG